MQPTAVRETVQEPPCIQLVVRMTEFGHGFETASDRMDVVDPHEHQVGVLVMTRVLTPLPLEFVPDSCDFRSLGKEEWKAKKKEK